jgi:lipoyl(octanoyl) transferase
MAQLMRPHICRLLPFAVANGPQNMAADEVFLESAVSGTPSLRFYGWREATLSLGYFQKEELRRADPLLESLPYVRRPTGGATLVHHQEVTYALAVPAGQPWQTGESWIPRMHGILAIALAELGVECGLQLSNQEHSAGPLCFKHFSPGDLLIGQAKIAGSAQRRQRGALLQHGAILLARSIHTPALPGILELTGRRLAVQELCSAVSSAFTAETGWPLTDGEWTPTERDRVKELGMTKYSQDWWNRKR